jgi:hypothetical protein
MKFESCVAFSLGNPVELSKPVLVSNTQQFKVYAIKSDSVIEPTFHPCLQARVHSVNASSVYKWIKIFLRNHL